MSKDTTLIADNSPNGAGTGAAAPRSPEAPPATEPTPAVPPAAVPPAAGEAIAASAPVPSLSGVELEALQARASKAEENRDRYLRTAADFENFKKRAARERQEGIRFANEALLGKLLAVLDNFETASASDRSATSVSGESFRTGVALIHSQLKNVLAEAGLEEIDAAGQPFNPNLHEAVAQHESAEVPEGHVLQQLRKGYKYRDRLLRPAMVVVAKPPAAPTTSAAPATA
jgi:molecular chaperone GrpE